MDNSFLIKLLLSFFIGGGWAIFATVVVDKLGSKIGGQIVGLPSTALFGFFFIAWTQNPQAAVSATTVAPAAFGATVLFLIVFIYLLKNNIGFTLFASFLIWLIVSSIFIITGFNNFLVSLLIYIILLLSSYFFVEKILKVKSLPSKKIVYTSSIIFFRGLLSGIMVSLVVLIAKLGDPIIGGILSAFPALFTSTLIIVYVSQGADFSKGFAKNVMLGTINIVVYTVAVRFTYVPFGIFLGTATSIIASLLSSFFIYQALMKKLE